MKKIILSLLPKSWVEEIYYRGYSDAGARVKDASFWFVGVRAIHETLKEIGHNLYEKKGSGVNEVREMIYKKYNLPYKTPMGGEHTVGYYVPRQQPNVDLYGYASCIDPVKETWIDEAEKKIKAAKEDPQCAGVIIIRKRQSGRMALLERVVNEEGDHFFDNFSATEQPLPELTVNNTGDKYLRPEETPEDNL